MVVFGKGILYLVRKPSDEHKRVFDFMREIGRSLSDGREALRPDKHLLSPDKLLHALFDLVSFTPHLRLGTSQVRGLFVDFDLQDARPPQGKIDSSDQAEKNHDLKDAGDHPLPHDQGLYNPIDL
ncbi:MAG: hypothetical protein ACNY01_11445 [Desulfobacteria bacterium]